MCSLLASNLWHSCPVRLQDPSRHNPHAASGGSPGLLDLDGPRQQKGVHLGFETANLALWIVPASTLRAAHRKCVPNRMMSICRKGLARTNLVVLSLARLQRRSCFPCSPFCKGSFPVLGSDSEDEPPIETGHRSIYGPREEAAQRRAADGFVIRTRASLDEAPEEFRTPTEKTNAAQQHAVRRMVLSNSVR